MIISTPLRYPGGKGKLTDFIKLIFEENGLLDGHYAEPYAGGAGIALNLLVLEYASCIHLNDVDPSVFAFWSSVINSPDELCKKITDAKLTMREWRRQKAIQNDPGNYDSLDLGFSTFFLNRTNRSGILQGGVIGGYNQTGTWKIDARFNKIELRRRIEKIALYRSRIRLHNLDAIAFIDDVIPSLPSKSLVYLDPPYYNKADRLYKNFYQHADHVTISKRVKKLKGINWIVSYDNAPEIVAMYRGCRTITYGMNYSAGGYYEGSETMFFSRSIKIPSVESPANPIPVYC